MFKRLILAALITLVMYVISRKSTTVGVSLAFVYLAMLGGVRRLLTSYIGYTSTDPLLLVVPATMFITMMNLGGLRDHSVRTPFFNIVSGLLLVMGIQVFNPLQGSLLVGGVGVLFYVVPLLWFYIGRKDASEEVLSRFFKVTIVTACVAAVYGLYQTWFGFNQSELQWAENVKDNYNALQVGVIRPFSFLTSAAEYGTLLGVAIVLLWTAVTCGNWFAFIPLPLLAYALFLESSRGSLLNTIIACIVVWSLQGHRRLTILLRFIAATFLCFIGLQLLVVRLGNMEFDERIQPLIFHQISNLADPFNETSTLPEHLQRVYNGIRLGFEEPWGQGLGSTTLATTKFGGVDCGTETDVSNLFVSLGLVGGFLYIAFMSFTLVTAFRIWRMNRDAISLSILAMLIMLLGNWLNSGMYTTTMLVWFSLGALDRMHLYERLKQSQLVPPFHECSVVDT